MSELALCLLRVIQLGPIEFSELWNCIPYEASFEEMEKALAELIEAGQIEKIGDTFAFRVKSAA